MRSLTHLNSFLCIVEPTERIIMGIDPGTTIMGYGVIAVKGKNAKLLALGVVQLHKLENQAMKLKKILEKVWGLIDEFHPDEVAIEAPFFGENVQSMLKLGRAQGVAMAAALHRGLPIFEYAPRKIKQSITGNGSASKEQVAAMLKQILAFNESPKFMDATDGLAVAYCHFLQNDPSGATSKRTLKGGKKAGTWDSFLKENPDRLKKP